jgi:hypothetical protein
MYQDFPTTSAAVSETTDYKYNCSLEESISEYIAEYDAVAKDFELTLDLKLRFFHVIFSSSAKRFSFSKVEQAAVSYTDVRIRMENEFNSPSRQQRVLQTMSTLKFSQFLRNDNRNGLNDMVEKISTLSPMCPSTHKQEAHMKKFLYDACGGEPLASAALSRVSAEPECTFHAISTHLAAAVQLFMEEQDVRRMAQRRIPPGIPINLIEGRNTSSERPSLNLPKYYGSNDRKERSTKYALKSKGPSAERPCRGCGSTTHWLRDGICKGKDVADFLKKNLHNFASQTIYELMEPEETSNNIAQTDTSSEDESGPERTANFVLTGTNEDTEPSNDLIYESLITQQI